MSYADQAATWLSRLVQIPSVTPIQAGPRADVPGEARIAHQIADWFDQLGGAVEIEEVAPGRPNVYGIWEGATDEWVAVDVHTDTVGVEQMSGEPFSGAIKEGRVYGRGAVDTKASLGIMLALLESMQAQGKRPRPNVVIGATVDEEFGATGAPACAAWLRRQPFSIAQLVVAEPTQCIPIYGHRGVARCELTFSGKAAHTSQPEQGQNAVVAAAQVILALAKEHENLQQRQPTELGLPSLTPSVVHGGVGINVVPDHCTLMVDRRLVDGEDPRAVLNALYTMAQKRAGLPVEMETLREMAPFLQPADSPWIAQLSQWTQTKPQVAPFGTNAWAYRDLPGACVVMGPGSIDQAHGAEEWVDIAELDKMAAVYAKWWGLDPA